MLAVPTRNGRTTMRRAAATARVLTKMAAYSVVSCSSQRSMRRRRVVARQRGHHVDRAPTFTSTSITICADPSGTPDAIVSCEPKATRKGGPTRKLCKVVPYSSPFFASAARGLPFPESGSRRRFSPHPQPRPRDDENWAKATEDKDEDSELSVVCTRPRSRHHPRRRRDGCGSGHHSGTVADPYSGSEGSAGGDGSTKSGHRDGYADGHRGPHADGHRHSHARRHGDTDRGAAVAAPGRLPVRCGRWCRSPDRRLA